MKPYIWGKYLWTSIHFISLGYPSQPSIQDKVDYQMFFENFYKVLPCNACSENYEKHLLELPLTDNVLESNKSLFKWTVDLHNLVNKSLTKKSMSYDEAHQLYTITHDRRNNVMDRCFRTLYEKKSSTWMNVLLIFFNIIIILIFVLTFMRRFSGKPS
jgi:ATP-dependent Zn protease